MRKRHTRHTDHELEGRSHQVCIRVPMALLDRVQAVIDSGTPDIHSMADAGTDALWLWCYEHEKLNGV